MTMDPARRLAPAPAPIFKARVESGGQPFDAPADQPLLQAALRAGVAWPSACKVGTCRRCLCRLLAGRVEYRMEWPGISAEEKAEGLILPCVAYPVSDVVMRAGAD